MTSYEISASTTTTMPPERIFAVLDDFGGWPRWMPALDRIKVELPAGQRPSPGYRFRLRGSVVFADLEVIDYTALSRATSFRISFPPLTGVNRCELRQIDGDRYHIKRVDSLNLPEIVAGLIDSTQRARFARLAKEFLEALLRAAEAEG
ncbi:SRPBCC family protein [Oscillochloris sp. ZM17-4]|uniref:SRPBCC family protein n=1 Tax=Oscillochloris sp. ZM17-4 TaxID=2866714 RepID=UPI001C7333B8|nr:SRPBCC family protein [Oscillochloris sp. ZM17-4]MBX0327593.1 SRPBCC family protein [Oscillochloris sp. ZM17-4]